MRKRRVFLFSLLGISFFMSPLKISEAARWPRAQQNSPGGGTDLSTVQGAATVFLSPGAAGLLGSSSPLTVPISGEQRNSSLGLTWSRLKAVGNTERRVSLRAETKQLHWERTSPQPLWVLTFLASFRSPLSLFPPLLCQVNVSHSPRNLLLLIFSHKVHSHILHLLIFLPLDQLLNILLLLLLCLSSL